MTEALNETVIEQGRPARPNRLGAAALQSARELTGEALGKQAGEVTIDEIAQQFTQAGFNTWPADTARTVRNLLASEFGFDHL
jgi:hypothetical protein